MKVLDVLWGCFFVVLATPSVISLTFSLTNLPFFKIEFQPFPSIFGVEGCAGYTPRFTPNPSQRNPDGEIAVSVLKV